MARRRRALAAHRADLLYDEPHSRVGTRFLEAVVERCGVPAGGPAGVCAGAARRRNETAADEACRRKVGV